MGMGMSSRSAAPRSAPALRPGRDAEGNTESLCARVRRAPEQHLASSALGSGGLTLPLPRKAMPRPQQVAEHHSPAAARRTGMRTGSTWQRPQGKERPHALNPPHGHPWAQGRLATR